MDPALRELLRAGGDPDRTVEAIIRLARPGLEIPGVRTVARFGHVATCRLRLGDVRAVHGHRDVVSLKAARPLGPGHGSDRAAGARYLDARPTDVRRPRELGPTG